MPARDLTAEFNTKLSPHEEKDYQAWKTRNKLKDTAEFDYDLRGAWQAGASKAANGHLPDTFKKPNHPTFSEESQYNGVNGVYGGRWEEKAGKWTFHATDDNLKNMPAEELNTYFKTVEPDSGLVLPAADLRGSL